MNGSPSAAVSRYPESRDNLCGWLRGSILSVEFDSAGRQNR